MNNLQFRLKIGQLNAGRGAIVIHEIRKLAEELQLDILCLQEPYVKDGAVPGLPQTARTIVVGQHPMAAIVVLNREVAVPVIQQYTDEH